MNTHSRTDLLRSSLEVLVLSALRHGPMYGYRISKHLAHRSQQRVKLPPGTLYPLLHRLEDQGLVRSRWDEDTGRKRKWYELTAKGRRRLQQQARQWVDWAACITALLAPVLAPAGSSD